MPVNVPNDRTVTTAPFVLSMQLLMSSSFRSFSVSKELSKLERRRQRGEPEKKVSFLMSATLPILNLPKYLPFFSEVSCFRRLLLQKNDCRNFYKWFPRPNKLQTKHLKSHVRARRPEIMPCY